MNKEERYHKVVKLLAKNKPVLDDRESMTEDIMSRIKETGRIRIPKKSINDYAFSWVNNGWFRMAMGTAAAILVGLFFYQQVLINVRISNMEDQLIKTVNTINGKQTFGIDENLLLETLFDQNVTGDSIMISRDDLETFLKAYLEAEHINEYLIGSPVYRARIQEMIRNRAKETTQESEVSKNL